MLQRRGAAGLNEQLELERPLADLGDELLRALWICLRPGLEARVVGKVRRRDRAIAHEPPALRRALLEELVTVDGHRDGLDVALLVEEEARRLVRNEAVPGERPYFLIGEGRVRLDRGHVLARDPVDELRVSGTEIREPHIRIDDGPNDDLVEVRELAAVGVLAPPVRVLLERVVIGLHGLGEDERTRPCLERLEREVRAQRRLNGLRDHHARAIDERPEQRRERGLEIELHGLRVNDGDGIDGAQITRPLGTARRLVSLDVPLDRVGVECRPILEFDIGPKRERHGLAVARRFPLVGEPPDDVALRRHSHERVVHRVHDVSIDEQA